MMKFPNISNSANTIIEEDTLINQLIGMMSIVIFESFGFGFKEIVFGLPLHVYFDY